MAQEKLNGFIANGDFVGGSLSMVKVRQRDKATHSSKPGCAQE